MTVSGVLATIVMGAGTAQTAPQLYPLPRYEEDWSFLRDPSRRVDFWDPVKFIPLRSDGDRFLSLGAEARLTYERFRNTNFGLSAQDPDGYLLQRYLFHFDLHYGLRWRFFGELDSSLEQGRTGGPRPVDQNRLDTHQAFFDLHPLKEGSPSDVTLRAGRAEMAYGSGRLVALREGVNVPLSFDGARVTFSRAAWRIDAFASRPVQNRPGTFDDESLQGVAFWGLYTSRARDGGAAPGTLDFYYFGLDRDLSVYDQGPGTETRHTLGVRLQGRRSAWSYDAEGMYQFGRFASGAIAAWRLAADTGYTFSEARGRPRWALAVDVASGDRDPASADLQTFNALFQSGTYSGRAQILGPANTIRLEPSVGLTLTPSVAFSSGWGFYWRQSIHDGLYGVSGILLVPGNGVTARYEGSRPIVQVDWQVTRHLSAHLNYIYVFNAAFEEESVQGSRSLSYVSPWVTYRF